MLHSKVNETQIFARHSLSSVTVPLEMEPQLENVIVELTAESTLVTELPFAIHNFKC